MVKREWPRPRPVVDVVPARLPGQKAADQTSVRDAEQIKAPAANHREIWWASRFRRLLNVFSAAAPIAAPLRRQNQGKGFMTVVKQRSRRWIATQRKCGTLARVWAGAGFADSLYILLSTPLRVGFFFNPWNDLTHRDAWPPELVAFTVLDVVGSLLRLWSSRATLLLGLRRLLTRPKVDQSPQLKKQEVKQLDRNMHNATFSSTSTRSSSSDGLIGWLVLATSCCPWELVLLVALRGRHANSLHLFGLLRLVSAFRGIGTKLAAAAGGIPPQLESGTVANVIVLFLVGLYLCHCAASGYMLLAHWECGLSFTSCPATTPALPGCWVLRDRLERGSRLRQYVRTLYWACKTVVTLGQGDVIPVTIAETGYRIVIQFCAGLWVTAILTAYTFYFTHKDANMTTNISTRLAQASQFLVARRAPAQLIASVDAYFQYMQRTRNGVEEGLIMAALPPHYRVQCSHYVRYKALGRLAIFRRRKGAFLRTLMGGLVRDVCAPGQTLLRPGEADEMFIVVSGEIRLLDARGTSVGVLVAGAAYAEYALFERHLARHRLEAATFCELWYLPSRSFKAALAKHFSKLVYASLLLKHFGAKEADTEKGYSDADDSEGSQRVDSVTSMKKRARESKVLGHGSIIMQALEARKLLAAATAIASADSNGSKSGSARWRARKVAAWRLLNSKFRKQWALAECALILFLLVEVPHQIAFQRGFGLLNDFATFPTAGAIPERFQLVNFVVALAVELFFYVDLWLRARCFVRPRHSAQDGQDFLDGATRTASSQINLVGLKDGASIPTLATRSSHIFQLYLQQENLVLEVLALAPVALVWDVLPKEWFTRRTVYILRFLRLLRLLRARNLHGRLHALLSGRGVGPALRLLADVVVFCVAMSHAAACLYFAVADTTSFAGGLPLGGVEPRSLSPFACLEDASVFDNCTWYMYDRSTFDIDAPYVRSILWSVVLLSTVGFGDIVAFSTRECVVDALWIFLGANICYFTSCALSSVLAQLNVLSAIRHDRIEGINVLLMSPSMASVSDATKRLVRSYYEAKWKLNGSAVGDLELLMHLPRSLRRAVSTQLYAADMRRCALFTETAGVNKAGDNGDGALFLQQLTLVVTCEHFLRNVTVTKEGHLASDFFVILSGELECLLPPVPLVVPSQVPSTPSSHRLTRHAIHFAASARAAQKLTTSTFRLLKDKSDEAQDRGHSNSLRSSPQFIKREQKPIPPNGPRPRSMAKLLEGPSAQPPKVLRYGSLSLVVGPRRGSGASGAPIPISILKQHDSFGEESLSDIVKLYEVSVRVVSSARVAVVRRRDFLVLAARFPQYVARLRARKRVLRAKAGQLVAAHRANFQGCSNKKIVRVLGTCESLYVDGSKMLLEKRGARVLDPSQPFARWWHRGIGGILVYNFYAIVYRLAFLPYPSPSTFVWLTGIDWVLDVLLFADIYLKYGHLGYVEFGDTVLDPEAIRRRYRASGCLWQDCLGMLPLYYLGDSLYMTTTRIPRLLRCLQLSELLQEVHTEIQERYLRGNAVLLSVFDLVKFFLIFVSTAHYVGSLYYLLGWLQIESGLVTTSWTSVDLVLIQNPNRPLVHYMRSMYWCLSAFTVDCFGDILARNFLETCYELFTCVLGWIFIGQVIGRINALMITLDKARKQRNDRVEDFQQYAKQRALPDQLRLRAMEGLAVKAQCQLELEMPTTLRDLPGSLRALVAVEMYSTLLQPMPEFAALSLAQLEAVARALTLEIYLPGDMIYEANRVGMRLYLLKYGCAERFAPRTGVVYGALTPGALFGEFAFFLPGARRLASIRAVRSCQVLQLDRRVWDRLWPPDVRAQVERSVLEVVARKYRRTARSFLNVAKNFYIKSDTPVPALGRQSPSRPSLRWHQIQKCVKSKVVGASTSESMHVSIPAFLRRSNSAGLVPAATLGLGAATPSHRRESTSDMPVLSKRHEALEPIRSTRETAVRLSMVRSISPVDLPIEASVSVSRADDLPPRPSIATAAVPGHPIQVNRWVLEEPSEPLARLSAATDLRWKRHEKRLRAIQLFYVDWESVEQDLRHLGDATGMAAKRSRRASICVPPSYTDARAAQLGKTATRSQLGRGERRHSIQSDPTELRLKFRLSSAEVRILEQRMVVSTATAAPSSAQSLAATSAALTKVAPRSRWPQWGRRRSLHKGKVAPSGAAKTPQGRPLALHSAPYRIWVTPSVHMAQLDRHARFRVAWTVVMQLVTLYYVVVIPLQIGFLDAVLNDAENEAIILVVFALEYAIADMACLVDFALHRRYFVYLNSSGQPVTDPQRIARHYWRRGLYLVDLLAMVPLELLMLTFVLMLRQAGHAPPPAPTSTWPLFFSPSGGLLNWHTFSFLRVNRFLRVVHLHPLTDRIQRFLLYDAQLPGLTPGVCYIVRLALDFLLGTHWLSCLFYGVSYLAYADGQASWLTTPDMLVFGGGVRDLAAVRAVPVLQAYLRSCHFSIGAITTVCYGDILPMNALETVVTMAVIFISVAFFSMLSGGFFKYFDMELGRRAEYEEKVAQTGHFLRFHRFPSETWRQMQLYFALSWRESRGRNERELLRGLPPSVRHDLALHVHANLLHNVTLFTRCDPAFARAVVSALQLEFFVRNDVIIQRGDMERSLYIVESGLVAISAVRKRVATPEGGTGDAAAVDADANEPAARDDTPDSPAVSVNRWVAMSVRASHHARSMRDSTRQQVVQLLSPVTDINERTEREEKIFKGPFDYFGERSLLFGTPRNATCVALCVSSLFVLTSARFEAILDEFPHERSNSVSAWVMTRVPARVKSGA